MSPFLKQKKYGLNQSYYFKMQPVKVANGVIWKDSLLLIGSRLGLMIRIGKMAWVVLGLSKLRAPRFAPFGIAKIYG